MIIHPVSETLCSFMIPRMSDDGQGQEKSNPTDIVFFKIHTTFIMNKFSERTKFFL
jgi:hypothetical protein